MGVCSAFEQGLSKFEGELHVKTSGRTYKLLAESHEQMRKWVKAIEKATRAAHETARAAAEGGGHFAQPLHHRLAANSSEGAALGSLGDESWVEGVSTEQEVVSHVLRRVSAIFHRAALVAQEKRLAAEAAAAAAGEEVPESTGSEIETLLQAADETLVEMFKAT